MTTKLPFTQLSIRRRIEAARKAGLYVIGIASDGTVLTSTVEKAPESVSIVPSDRQTADAARWRTA